MAEEIVLRPDLNRDSLARGGKNEKVALRLRLYTHPDFVKANPKTFCDVVLVVDTSESMDEPFGPGANLSKREGVIQAIEVMLKFVQPEDTLSLICYDSAVYQELDHVPGGEKSRIEAALPKILQHCGRTNFEKAFDAARALIGSGRHASRRVCFLTDGQANEGNTDRAHQLNQDLAAAGATVDCLGVGGDFNFSEMQRFTTVSNGSTELLATPAQAGEIFAKVLKSAQRALVGNAVLRLALAAGMRDVEIYQLTPEVRFFEDVKPGSDGAVSYRINLQTLTQTDTYTYLVQMGVDLPTDPNRANLALGRVRLDYDIPVKNLRGQFQENELVLNLAGPSVQERRDTTVDSDLLEVSLAKLNQQVNDASRQQDWKRAGVLLREMARRAHRFGDADKARVYERHLDNLGKNGCLTQTELNQILSGTSKSTRQFCGAREPDKRDCY